MELRTGCFNMKRRYFSLILGIFLIGLIGNVYAQLPTGGVSYCCEKTVGGAWCQNSPVENCNENFRKVPTSCEATSYCKLGTCINQNEGTCMENTPQRVCEENKGVWSEKPIDEVPQCSLGCCLIGDQASFVTQTRCKRLSSLYGLETNFRTDIGDEVQCIFSAASDVKGACVFEEEFERTCKMTTKRDCLSMIESKENASFHEGYLCTDESLATICGKSDKTTCVEGRDEVFFLDSCGNIANIYDSSKKDDPEYWSKIKTKGESCNPSSSNADSSTCGNCDYYLGSTCKTFSRGKDKIKPVVGENICRDLSCTYKGKTYSHGETWCDNSLGADKNLPGSRYFRLVCYNNEVSVEPCADFRQEVCSQSVIDGFSVAACIVNKWQDCNSQTTKQDCENIDRRDCKWIEGIGLFAGGNYKGSKGMGACVANSPSGSDFWSPEGDTEQICSTASTECIVEYESGLSGGKKCVKNCECLSKDWEEKMNQACVALGDCGSSVNYVGVQGYVNQSAITRSKFDEEEEEDGGMLGGLF
jgi:hypothetical protein